MVKHIALRSKSMRNGEKPYTTPGLGDRAHHVLFAYQYAMKHDTEVVLHLTHDKYGKQHKKDSWRDLTEMANNKVSIEVWPVANLDENLWLTYLSGKNIDASLYYYSDTFGIHPFEEKLGIDAAPYFKVLPCIDPIVKVDLPEKYITVQWDSTDSARSITADQIELIENKYRDEGYDIITIGGQAEGELKTSLKHIGAALHGAKYHVGVDSGMMHIAQFYKRWQDIYIHNYGFRSHHFYRAEKNGSHINQL